MVLFRNELEYKDNVCHLIINRSQVVTIFFLILPSHSRNMNFSGAKEHILNLLNNNLPPGLHYHSVEHTIDVYKSANRLIFMEMPDERQPELILTAALWHDSGMLTSYRNHEEASVEMSRKMLPSFGYTKDEIETVSSLIMVTKLPQRANTLSEQILCDADLDYLGREDFFIRSFQLQLEWKLNNILSTTLPEWFDIQVRFLSEHEYFTQSARKLRSETKKRHLTDIKNLIQTLKVIPNS